MEDVIMAEAEADGVHAEGRGGDDGGQKPKHAAAEVGAEQSSEQPRAHGVASDILACKMHAIGAGGGAGVDARAQGLGVDVGSVIDVGSDIAVDVGSAIPVPGRRHSLAAPGVDVGSASSAVVVDFALSERERVPGVPAQTAEAAGVVDVGNAGEEAIMEHWAQ